MKKVIIFLVVFLISFNTFATAFHTGNDLKSKLNSSSVMDNAYALGYVAGISDGLSKSKLHGFQACIPANVELGQLQDIVKIFFDKRPEILHFGASGLISSALTEAFPCSLKNPR